MRFKTRLKPAFSLIDLTPLVDVVFLILIFFIVTSEILPLKSLHIENPRVAFEGEPVTTRLILVMDAQNVIYLGSKKNIVDFPSLKEALKSEYAHLLEKNPATPPTLVLSIDKRVEYDAVLKLIATAEEVFSSLRLVLKSE
jgi:biopolymer transport protein ExbD